MLILKAVLSVCLLVGGALGLLDSISTNSSKIALTITPLVIKKLNGEITTNLNSDMYKEEFFIPPRRKTPSFRAGI